MPIDLEDLLQKAGFRGEGLNRVKLSQGVIGKVSSVAIGTLAVFAIAAYGLRGQTWALLAIAGLAFVLFSAYLFCTMWFANRHPGVALLEGAELLRWRQMEMSAKEMPEIPASPVVREPDDLPAALSEGRSEK